MKNKSIIFILTMLVLSLTHEAAPSSVYACSCGGVATAKQVMDISDVVLLGKVISITESTPVSPRDSVPFTGREVLFEVVTLYKGEQKAQYVVHTGKGGGDCGVGFTVGETVVVFASEWDNQPLRTALCWYLRPNGAPPDQVVLGSGRPTSEQSDSFTSYFVSVIALVVLTSVVALIIKRRRKAVDLQRSSLGRDILK